MNPLINPLTSIQILTNYFLKPDRFKRLNQNQMKKYRDKQFRRIVKYAYNVPVYHRKYKKAGVNPEDIKSIDDIKKLPFVTKKDFIENFPDGIVPKDYKKSNGYVVSTGGSSGKPVSIYTDFDTMIESVFMSLRQGKIYGYNIRKARFADIGTHLPGRFDKTFGDAITSNIKLFKNPDSIISINAFEPIKDIVDKLNRFKPDIIYTYPVTLQHIAYLKKKGYCPDVNPKFLHVSGYSIDEYTTKYIENVFGCKVLNLYQSVEGSGTIAYECYSGIWHINHDWYHLETIDEDNNLIESGKRGHVVLTRLFGRGTPILRYTGMDDWVTLKLNNKCSCGINGPILKKGVEGRISARVILPDGRVYPAASFELVSLVLTELKTYKIIQFQTIQNKIDELEINLVVDNDLRNVGPSLELIFKKVYDLYREKCGPGVKITVREVDKIKSPKNKPSPIVVSKIDVEEGLKQLEKHLYKNNK